MFRFHRNIIVTQQRRTRQGGRQALRVRSGVDGREQRRRQLDDAASGRRGQPVPEERERRDEIVWPNFGWEIRVRRALPEGVLSKHRRETRGQLHCGLLVNRLRVVTACICGRRSSCYVCQKRSSEYTRKTIILMFFCFEFVYLLIFILQYSRYIMRLRQRQEWYINIFCIRG